MFIGERLPLVDNEFLSAGFMPARRGAGNDGTP
jgi:hypothetical protein